MNSLLTERITEAVQWCHANNAKVQFIRPNGVRVSIPGVQAVPAYCLHDAVEALKEIIALRVQAAYAKEHTIICHIHKRARRATKQCPTCKLWFCDSHYGNRKECDMCNELKRASLEGLTPK
jgi:hypothetical protein